jgi:hypothetical protein
MRLTAVPAAVTAPPAGPPAARGDAADAPRRLRLRMRLWRFLHTPKGLLLLVFLPLLLVGGGAPGWQATLPHVVAAVAGAVLVDLLVACVALRTLGGLVAPAAAAELFRPPFLQAALFLALFMLTDPPTAPARPAEQVGIGLLGAAVACLAQVLGAGQTYLLIGLLAGNLALAGRRWLGPLGPLGPQVALGAQGGRDGTPSKEPARG